MRRSAALASRACSHCAISSLLEDKLQCELNFARLARPERLPKGAAVRNVAVHAVELGVIKQVIKLRPEFSAKLFRYLEALVQAGVKIRDPGAAADRAW